MPCAIKGQIIFQSAASQPINNNLFLFIRLLSSLWPRRFFGKRKLKEKISPKKTIEGFIGGLLAALIGGVIIFNTTLLYSPPFWLLLALLVSVLGTTGDLIQSKFKRLAGVKDSGRIMPGHGGVYDRLDSIIFASPFIYLFIIFINYVS